MNVSSPFISIVTVVRDDRVGFLRTRDSVYPQLGAGVEWIVVDGGSSDGTSEVIRSIPPHKIAAWVSEPDQGIADAFNKGINLANGQYILFLNAGDTLADPTVLERVARDLGEQMPDVWVGRIRTVVRGKAVIIGGPVGRCRQLLRNYLPHQAMFIRAELFPMVGVYDTSFRLGMDYEWSLRMFKKDDLSLTFHPTIVARMEPGGVGSVHFVETFLAYHRARVLHGRFPAGISLSLSWFYILRRSIWSYVRHT